MAMLEWLVRAGIWLSAVLWLCGCGASAPEASKAADPNAVYATSDAAAPGVTRGAMMEEEFAGEDMDDERVSRGEPAPQAPGAPPPPPVTKPDAPPSPRPPEIAGDKTAPLLVYRAELHMAVYEAAASIDAVQQAATDLGGYLVRRDQQSIVVRVPAAKYREALAVVGKLGDVSHREETVQDVTEQFYDLQARLRNARVVRDRLEQLLVQAKNVDEALNVERELARVTGEIERIEGKLELLEELVSFSTITVIFQGRPTDQVDSAVKLPFPWLDQLGLSNLLSL
jgi:hypothetical protein